MAITRGSFYNSGGYGSAATFDMTATVSSGQALVVGVIAKIGRTVSGVVWDQGGAGESLSLAGSQPDTSGGGTYKVWLYYHLSPTAGTSKTIRVTQDTGDTIDAMAWTYSGHGTSAIGNTGTNHSASNGSSDYSFSATAGTANSFIVSFLFDQNAGIAVSTGLTSIGTGFFANCLAADSGAVTGAQTLHATTPGTFQWVATAWFELKEAGGGGGGTVGAPFFRQIAGF